MDSKVYQIKITIKEITPPIWRRLLIPEDISFHKLHKIIQASFGWRNYHLYNFDFGDTVVCLPDPDYPPGEMYGPGVEELNAKRVKIDGFLHEQDQFTYTYDFGDNWEHEVVVEKILAAGEDEHYPRCIGGERHRPPEDVGGVGAYADFLRIIADPKHPEHDEYLVWAEKDAGGRKFDPEYFYLSEINRALARVKVTEKKAPPKKST
ncbi:MAG: plasmid pRiA4b ORF-3 family protein [Firmicutes bacterium]|nr:plasmid pRiA4b ORF-3 family protein [Bacillota bacterium]